MHIITSVIVKQVLTESSKTELLDKLISEKSRYEKEYEQLRFEMKKSEHANRREQTYIQDHFQAEMKRRMDKIDSVKYKLEQLNQLPLGSELIEREYQTMTEVQLGDRWSEISKNREIVVKDDLVVEIREH